MRDSREKGAGMRDQDPLFQTLVKQVVLGITAPPFIMCLRSTWPWSVKESTQPKKHRHSTNWGD